MVRDTKDSAMAGQQTDAYKKFQAQYGERPEKARDIKKNLGKDDFLKIMISQMKNQDPLNPFKADQMGTQIAQFTSVEQLQNVNQNLNKMSTQNRPLEQLAMTNLIGKTVTIDRDRFSHVEGQNDSLTFVLPKDASAVEAVVLNDAGEEVIKKDLGGNKKGDVTFNWDGIKTNTLAAKSGTYNVRVTAKDDHDKPIEVSQRRQTRVIGISFEGAEPVFLVGNAEHQDKVTMRNIAKIEMTEDVNDKSKTVKEVTGK
jgi:flagellar basal-body rod modification protein FlgD